MTTTTTTDARVRVYYKLTLWAWRLRWAKKKKKKKYLSLRKQRRYLSHAQTAKAQTNICCLHTQNMETQKLQTKCHIYPYCIWAITFWITKQRSLFLWHNTFQVNCENIRLWASWGEVLTHQATGANFLFYEAHSINSENCLPFHKPYPVTWEYYLHL